jgi:hypothetical protein
MNTTSGRNLSIQHSAISACFKQQNFYIRIFTESRRECTTSRSFLNYEIMEFVKKKLEAILKTKLRCYDFLITSLIQKEHKVTSTTYDEVVIFGFHRLRPDAHCVKNLKIFFITLDNLHFQRQ